MFSDWAYSELIDQVVSKMSSQSSISLTTWANTPFIPNTYSVNQARYNVREYAEKNQTAIEWLFRNTPQFQLRIYTSISMPNQCGVTLFLPTKQDMMRWKLIR